MPLNAEHEIKEWIKRDNFHYAYLLDFYYRGAVLIELNENSLILFLAARKIIYAGGFENSLAKLNNADLVLFEDFNKIKELEKIRPVVKCHQYIWAKDDIKTDPDIIIRDLDEKDIPFILNNYHNPGAYQEHIKRRIKEGMIGAYINGQLVGFAGIHEEGSIGLLEVLPAYRRKGVAKALEKEMINRQLKNNKLAYCHVVEGNNASIALQKKIGMTYDAKALYWGFNKY